MKRETPDRAFHPFDFLVRSHLNGPHQNRGHPEDLTNSMLATIRDFDAKPPRQLWIRRSRATTCHRNTGATECDLTADSGINS